MEIIVGWLVDTVWRFGYPGIIMLMFLESSFFPFPSEVVVPPAGYLASQGEMQMSMVIFCGILGSLLGALFNYAIAYWLGRPLLIKYGRYMLLTRQRFDKVDDFFNKHGEISTFTCRLIPGIRQYISFPAGLARMDLLRFSLYTSLGASIWVVILAYIGYFVGNNKSLVMQYSRQATIALIIFITILIVFYFARNKKRIAY